MTKVIDICAKKRAAQDQQWKTSINESLVLAAVAVDALHKLVLQIDNRLKQIERGDCGG